MTTTSLRGRWASPNGRREAAYFLSFNAANVLNYAYLVLMGFLLGEDSYGLFGALFGVVYLTGPSPIPCRSLRPRWWQRPGPGVRGSPHR